MTKVVVVTGASKGIGKQIVKQLTEHKVDTIGIGRNTRELDELKKECKPYFSYHKGDLTNQKFVDELVSHLQGKEILSVVLNAGIVGEVNTIEKLNLDNFKDVFEINFFSICMLINKLIETLRVNKSNLVAISSGASVKPKNKWCAYSCSKSALNMLMKSVCLEEPLIKTISIRPGIVKTPLLDKLETQSIHKDKEFYDYLQKLKKENKLLDPCLPCKSIAKLLVKGIPQEYNGEYVSWDDEWLMNY